MGTLKANYAIDLSGAARAGQEDISDLRLAVFLGHPSEDSATELMTVRDPKTSEEYVLRLCGTVRLLDAQEVELDVEALRSFEDIDAVVDHLGRGALLTNPWFEWITADGDPVGEVFDTISINPNTELNCLEEIIATRHR